MKYRTHYRKYYFFVYRVPTGGDLDIRSPIGGVTAYGREEVEALDLAYQRAEQGFARRPGETLAVVRCTYREGKRQVWLLQQSKRRDDAKFMESLGVDG